MRQNNAKARQPHLLLCALLVAAALGVYWHVTGYGFVAFDDDAYVYANPHLLKGLDISTIRWAFTTTQSANWHPLTWLSLASDMQLTRDNGLPAVNGLPNARYFHLTNILLHLANVLLVYFVLFGATRFAWRSAFVAALFAVHPLHVESVAWITERKDVLSTFFWLLTMLAYLGWVNRRGAARYAMMVVLFALGLMAKPMLVSLPLVLLMMDYWPLGRASGQWTMNNEQKESWFRLIRERLPLFVLAAASCALTVYVQRVTGTAGSLLSVPLGQRLANAAVSCVGYILKMIWPGGLAALYPHPLDTLPVWQVIGSAIALAGLCTLAVKLRRTKPYFTIGWLWYLVTLLPVIGLVQVGRQGSADRYTYVPVLGLFIAIAWAVPNLFPARQQPKRKNQPAQPRVGLGMCAAAVVIAYAVSAYVQTGYWANSESLFNRMLAVTSNNYVAHGQLGMCLMDNKQPEEAIEHFEQALKIRPGYVDAQINLGLALTDLGRASEAVEHYRKAARLNPREPAIYDNMGYALLQINDPTGAERAFRTAAKINGRDVQAHNNLGCIYAKRGDFAQAVREFRTALKLSPDSPSIKQNLDACLAGVGRK
jgi:Flp pilus assembly protein TadD